MPGFEEKKRAAIDAAMRDEVYLTSVKIITEEGIGALTLDRIAKAIGVSRPTLYNYFSDRAGVLIFLEDRIFEPLGVRIEEISASNAPASEKLEDICRTIIDSIYGDRALVSALFHKEIVDDAIKESKMTKRERAIGVMQQVIEEGVVSGEFRSVPNRAAAEVVFGAISCAVDNMVYSEKFRRADDVVPPMLNVLLGGLERPEG